MSTLSQFFAGGTSFANELVFISSRTFVTPVKGTYLLTAIGGGGSGGGGGPSGVSSGYPGAGAGAGGFCQSLVKLPAGVTLTLTVGAGAAGVAIGVDGNTGGASSISGAGLSTLTAGGGSGGQHGNTSTSLRLGGAGGTASGGNLSNVTGQAGHNSVSTSLSSSGGGSVGIFGYTPTGVEGAIELSVWQVRSSTLFLNSSNSIYSVQEVQPYYGRYLSPKGQIQSVTLVSTSYIPIRYGRSFQDGYAGFVTGSGTASGEFSGGTGSMGYTNSGYGSCSGGNGGGGGSGAGYYQNSGNLSYYPASTSGAGGNGRCVIEWAPDA